MEEVNPIKMKVTELKYELGRRGLSQIGLKFDLAQRLQAAMDMEEFGTCPASTTSSDVTSAMTCTSGVGKDAESKLALPRAQDPHQSNTETANDIADAAVRVGDLDGFVHSAVSVCDGKMLTNDGDIAESLTTPGGNVSSPDADDAGENSPVQMMTECGEIAQSTGDQRVRVSKKMNTINNNDTSSSSGRAPLPRTSDTSDGTGQGDSSREHRPPTQSGIVRSFDDFFRQEVEKATDDERVPIVEGDTTSESAAATHVVIKNVRQDAKSDNAVQEIQDDSTTGSTPTAPTPGELKDGQDSEAAIGTEGRPFLQEDAPSWHRLESRITSSRIAEKITGQHGEHATEVVADGRSLDFDAKVKEEGRTAMHAANGAEIEAESVPILAKIRFVKESKRCRDSLQSPTNNSSAVMRTPDAVATEAETENLVVRDRSQKHATRLTIDLSVIAGYHPRPSCVSILLRSSSVSQEELGKRATEGVKGISPHNTQNDGSSASEKTVEGSHPVQDVGVICPTLPSSHVERMKEREARFGPAHLTKNPRRNDGHGHHETAEPALSPSTVSDNDRTGAPLGYKEISSVAEEISGNPGAGVGGKVKSVSADFRDAQGTKDTLNHMANFTTKKCASGSFVFNSDLASDLAANVARKDEQLGVEAGAKLLRTPPVRKRTASPAAARPAPATSNIVNRQRDEGGGKPSFCLDLLSQSQKRARSNVGMDASSTHGFAAGGGAQDVQCGGRRYVVADLELTGDSKTCVRWEHSPHSRKVLHANKLKQRKVSFQLAHNDGPRDSSRAHGLSTHAPIRTASTSISRIVNPASNKSTAVSSDFQRFGVMSSPSTSTTFGIVHASVSGVAGKFLTDSDAIGSSRSTKAVRREVGDIRQKAARQAVKMREREERFADEARSSVLHSDNSGRSNDASF